MATGAVITINSANSLFGNGLTNPLFSPSGFELFSDIINPIESARATGRTIKSELRNISLQLEISSTVDQLLKRDSEFSRAKKEVIENAKCAKNDQDVIYGALTNVKDKLSEFGDTVVAVDNRAASLIRERKLEFNKRYPHLESESEYRKRMDERSIWEKCKDFGYGFVHGYGLIGGIDSLINGRERFVEHKEAIKQKITEFACKVGEWVKRNWEALVAAIVVVAAAIVCIATFGAGTVFLVASLAAFAYAVADKIVAINNNGKGIVETLEANGFHHLSQFCKGFNWGLQITMVISGFKMNGLGADKLFINKASWLQNTKATKLIEGFSVFKGKGFLATVGNGAIFGSADMFIVDLAAYGINFAFSGNAQSNPSEYFKLAFKDTLKDTVSGFVIGGTVAGVSHIVVRSISFGKPQSNVTVQVGDVDDNAIKEINISLNKAPHENNIGSFSYDTAHGGYVDISVTESNVRITGDAKSIDMIGRDKLAVFEYKYKGDYRLNVQGIDTSGLEIQNHHLHYEIGRPSVKVQLPNDLHVPDIHTNIGQSWRKASTYEVKAYTNYNRNLNKYLGGSDTRNLKLLSEIITPNL